MPFWWRRRNRWWYNRRRRYKPRRRRYRRKRRFYKRNYRTTHRRRRRRRKKVRRKKPFLTVKQWQPETIKKCKIIGFTAHVVGAHGKQFACFADERFHWIAPKTPGGGGFTFEKFTLEHFYREHLLHRNIWTTSNTFLELCRYTGTTFKIFRHPHIDFIFAFSRSYPMIAHQESYMSCHPAVLLNSKHKKIIPSLKTQPRGKNYKKIHIKPPRQMTNKWFFQDQFADTGLFTIRAAACDLRYGFFGCCNENDLVGFFELNLQFYQNAGWGNPTGGTSWYEPYHGAPKQIIKFVMANGKQGQIDRTNSDYKKSISYDNGWFNSNFLQAIKITEPQQMVIPTTVGRYNPTVDDGIGNKIWLFSTLKNSYLEPTTDHDLILEGRPLWLMLYGFTNWVAKKKQDSTFLESYCLAIESPYIMPKKGMTTPHIPIDNSFYQGNGPYGTYTTSYMKEHWFPTLMHQQETINNIVLSGPFIPKLANQTQSTWELHSTYKSFFKWGGSQLPEQDTADPKKQHDWIVPGLIQDTLQIHDPQKQKPTSILHAWDWRRGLLTKTALKRMHENQETDESLSTDSESWQTPQKKKKGNALPVLENQEKKIQKCLLSLCEESTYQDVPPDNLQLLIQQQQQQQQQIKHNLLKLIADLKLKQKVLQMQTGMLP
nr:MAG: ORF1 [Torque teno midi virus]